MYKQLIKQPSFDKVRPWPKDLPGAARVKRLLLGIGALKTELE